MAILDCSHSLHFYFLITLIHIRITQPFSMSVLCSRTSGPFTSSHSSFNGSFLYPYFWGNTRVHLDVQVEGLLGTFSYYLCLLLLPLFFFFPPPFPHSIFVLRRVCVRKQTQTSIKAKNYRLYSAK